MSESVRLYQTNQCRVCDCESAVSSSLVRGEGVVVVGGGGKGGGGGGQKRDE